MKMIRQLMGCIREYKKPTILTLVCMVGEVAIEVLDQPEVAIQWRAAWKTPSLLSVFSDLFTRNGWLLFKCAAVFFVLDCFQNYSRVCRKHPKQLIL
mgnify:CR=1 FL=1